MDRYILAIDQGTQSNKLTIFDLQGNALWQEHQPLKPLHTAAGGVVEHPDDDLWTSLQAASRALMAKFDGDVNEILAIGLGSIRFNQLVLKANGDLAQPAISWMDDRAHQIYEKTTDDAVYVTASTGYLAYRLTGNRIDTAASYIGTWPIDMDKWDWTDEDMMFDFLNLPRTSLFKLVKPGGILGNVTEETAAATGLPKGLPVIATANDKAVEALGAGLKTGPDLLLSLGTYTTSMLQGNENHPFGTTRYYWTNFADVPDEYLYESNGVYRGMWTVSWFAKQFQGIGDATHESTLDVLTREAATVPPGSDGLLTILDWQPAADRPFRKGAFIGLDERHNRGHMFRSILEGLAFNLLDYSTAMLKELDRKVDRLVVTGGGAQNDIFMQLIADIFNLPAQRNVITDAAGLGAAINAAVGIGEYRTYDDAIAAMVKPADSFAPQADAVAQYAKVYEKYKNLHQLTDPVFKDLQTINGVAERGKVGEPLIASWD
jgi:sugar (pentulose or hexulose) kinase